jgi:MFS family permease
MSEPRTRSFQTLRHRDFRLLWCADTVSALGTQMQRVAITWQVFELTHSAFSLGLLGLFRFLPTLLFGLVGGVAADQRDRRKILIWTQAGMMISTAVLAVTAFTDSSSMPLIYSITFLSSAISAISNPSKQALIPALVPRRELVGAAATINLSMQIASVVGPAVGGVIIGVSGVGAAYTIDTLSFLAVIGAVLAMRTKPELVPITTRGFAAAVEGLKFLWGAPILLSVMALDFVATFFGASTTLMPIFAETVHHVGARGLGLLLSSAAAGAVIGGVALGSLPMPMRPGRVIVGAIVAYGACIAGFGLSPTMPLAMLFLAGSGAADSISMAMRHSIRNLVTPDEYRGRVAATHSTFAQGGPQLGELNAGALASLIGAPSAVAIGGTLTVLSCLVAVRKVPALVAYRGDSRDQAENAS